MVIIRVIMRMIMRESRIAGPVQVCVLNVKPFDVLIYFSTGSRLHDPDWLRREPAQS